MCPSSLASPSLSSPATDLALPRVDTIPVIGGHSGVTIVPLLSQSSPALPKDVLEDEAKLAELVKRIQFGGDGLSSVCFGFRLDHDNGETDVSPLFS